MEFPQGPATLSSHCVSVGCTRAGFQLIMAVKQKKGRFANLNERQRAAHLAAGMALLVQGSILSGALYADSRGSWLT
jgi:hypothetical protein